MRIFWSVHGGHMGIACSISYSILGRQLLHCLLHLTSATIPLHSFTYNIMCIYMSLCVSSSCFCCYVRADALGKILRIAWKSH